MEVVLGIIIGALILVVFFIVVAEVNGNHKIKALQARQESLNRELNIAKDQFQRRMENNNKDIAKELSKLDRNSTCFVGFSERVPVSLLIIKFIGSLGYDVTSREFKIIKKGEQGNVKGREREKTELSHSKEKES